MEFTDNFRAKEKKKTQNVSFDEKWLCNKMCEESSNESG